MNTVISRDGTEIAFDRVGSGPAVILVNGGPVDRSSHAQLAELLSTDFTVFNYDRRGRGDSGLAAPYDANREADDLEALIEEAGGSASVYGSSGGAICALFAAARGVHFAKLALWEPSYIVEGTRPAVPADYKQQLTDMVSSDRDSDALEYFLTVIVGLPAEFVAPLKQTPFWDAQAKLARYVIQDADIVRDYSIPVEEIATVKAPTLVLDGGTVPWLSTTADAVAKVLPHPERHTLTGQPHNVDAEALAPALKVFFADQ